MKVVSIFLIGVLEAFKSIFGSVGPSSETKHETIDLNISDVQLEKEHVENLLELRKDYNVNLFTKWLFLGLFISFLIGAGCTIYTKSITAIPILILSFVLYKFYENRKNMADMKYSFISFLFLSQEDLDKMNKTI